MPESTGNMRPIGYSYKRVFSAPATFDVPHVTDVYSLSACVSENFAYYIDFWRHNGYWLFDSPFAIQALARERGTSPACPAAGEIENALRAIGCPKQAAIARRAIAALEIEGAVTPESVEAAIHAEGDGRGEVLDALDKEYYSCTEPIADRLFAFVKTHRAAIRLR